MRKLRVSFLHLAPVTCDIEHNRRLVERAVNVAADDGADWVITPELCIPGYLFMKQIGTDWITPQPGPWMEEFCKLVKKRNVSVFLSHPERDPATDKLYNTVFVINQEGHIVGKHSKIKALGGAESWSTAGTKIVPVECGGVQAGILICADAYKNEIAQVFKDKGAQMLVSPVSWGPGHCGPDGEWEARSADTGLPMMVCNRSGTEAGELDYSLAESVVAQNGVRLLEATSDRSVVLSFDWDVENMSIISSDFERVYL